MLEELFVPTGELIQELIDLINTKFAIVEDIKTILEEFEIKNSSITLQFTMYGQTIKLMNFEWLDSAWYVAIKSFLVGYIYIRYLVSLYRKLPKIIRGGV